MTVGVKFCGGCNPIYSRLDEYNKLKERCPEAVFESYNPGKAYEKALLICGCQRTCLRFRQDEFKADEILVADSKEDMEAIRL